jgi:hypothetical protein
MIMSDNTRTLVDSIFELAREGGVSISKTSLIQAYNTVLLTKGIQPLEDYLVFDVCMQKFKKQNPKH